MKNALFSLFTLTIILFIPSLASAHTVGPGFLIFAVISVIIFWGLLTLIIGLAKYSLVILFWRQKWEIPRRKSIKLMMIDSAFYAAVLLGATPISLTSGDIILTVPERFKVITFYLLKNSPSLFGHFLNFLATLPLLYLGSVFINSKLFQHRIDSVKQTTTWLERLRLASAAGLITPIGILIAMFILIRPPLAVPESAIDSLFEDAVVDANVDLSRALLQHGANVNAISRYGGTILHTSFAFGRMPRAGTSLSIVKYLLDNGANVNAIENNNNATTIMKISEGFGRIEEFQLLLDKHPDLNTVDKEGNTALHYALILDQFDKASILISKGINIDRKNDSGRTVLMEAAQKGDEKAVLFLLDQRADIQLKDSCGWTALRIAVQSGHEELAKLLRDRGGNPNEVVTHDVTCRN